MKRIALIALACIIFMPRTTSAQQSRWQLLSLTPRDSTLIDIQTAKEAAPGLWEVWKKELKYNPVPVPDSTVLQYDVLLIRTQYNCSTKQFRYGEGSYYLKGQPVFSTTSDFGEWVNPRPESSGEAMLSRACMMFEHRKSPLTWTLIGAGPADSLYMDATHTTRLAPHQYQSWSRTVFGKDQPSTAQPNRLFRVLTDQVQVDCTTRLVRYADYRSNSKLNGDIVLQAGMTGSWQDWIPATEGDAIFLKAVCARFDVAVKR